MPSYKILAVDDEPRELKLLTKQLTDAGYFVKGCLSAQEAIESYKEELFHLVITDFSMPKMNGIDLLCEFKRVNPEILVILITGFGTIDIAVSAMKKGAFDFLTKPYSPDVLLYTISRALRVRSLEEETVRLHMELMDRYCFENMIGGSSVMKEVFKKISTAAISDSPCLIEGEVGTGKELMAKAMHYEGNRQSKPFIMVNCSTLSESLFDVEFFGLEKEALEKGSLKHAGKIEQAQGGTLFLENIEDLKEAIQDKIYSALAGKAFRRIGSVTAEPIDIRVIASSRVSLDVLVAQKKFNKELLKLISPIFIDVPPLRERKDDIPLLVKHFFTQYGLPDIHVDADVMIALQNYHWPGNIQELKNCIERLIILSPRVRTLRLKDLPPDIRLILKMPAEESMQKHY